MATTEDTSRTDMSYMDRLRGVALAGVALIIEKTATYGPSWKRRGGAGAWFTTVRPWDRLESIVDRHGGDVFAAVAADPSGADGSALACLRDIRNYTILIEAEMVARGSVEDPCPQPQSLTEEARLPLIHELDEVVSRHYTGMQVSRVEEHLDPDRGHEYQILLRCVPEPARRGVPVTEKKPWVEPEITELSEDAAEVAELREVIDAGRLGAGAIADGCYTVLDLGHGVDLWSVDLEAILPIQIRGTSREHMVKDLRRVFGAGILIASRKLTDDSRQIMVRIP